MLMRELSVPHDNWLSQYCRASFDGVTGLRKSIEGFSPTTHRLQTFAHDPLLGVVVGTTDVLRGGMTAVSRDGGLVVVDGIASGGYNVATALTIEVLHLVSDMWTPMGLPAPLWTLGPLADFGALGPDDLTIGELSRDICTSMATNFGISLRWLPASLRLD